MTDRRKDGKAEGHTRYARTERGARRRRKKLIIEGNVSRCRGLMGEVAIM